MFLRKSDHPVHALQVKIAAGTKKYQMESRERYLRSPSEATKLFFDVPEAVAAAEEIAEK